ncbi:5-formyltetrahydrofolate cyclo-ligase [Proteiniclasticum sp. QWL-01]|jgi:5-formyltetrahydrofolate cyclo-ligase|uniref:5-formyltetrahydrofolate cyclo-ligase n=1 Tax=Proteiniclasticum sp. QWL-01 TaxID=3036945 RepID=UPI00220228A9|nr:5-formyltetrahydrofolate cyclo-ligase [Proteiniclasticum sp. QWL-01]UUM13315.1 5-formyltetrahydrofolate cyclo-ligase [Clostridiaceae bacterium HFYG-1003]WFF71744.1 5-formyltetrahydrofolate cyclo-ligase [Proteiniclasticum sp. QWL-01]
MDLNQRQELKEFKKALRRETLSKRKQLAEESPERFHEYSSRIIDTLKQTPEYQNARILMCFVSFEDEVETHQFIKDALTEGKQVYVPYIIREERIMVPAQILNFDEDLVPGYYGILSPREDQLRLKDKAEIDLVVTPGVLFDKNGYRIGYGAGFYDRFFSQIEPSVPKIAIAFSLQQTEEVPTDEFDIPVNKLITEKGITIF